MKPPQLHLGPRARKIVRYAGITVAALVMFVFALQMTFPYERVKDKLIDALADKYDIVIKDVERGWVPGRVYFNAVQIRTRPTKPGEVVNTFFIERLEVDLAFLPLLGKKLSLDLGVWIGPPSKRGKLAVNVALPGWGADGFAVRADGHDLPAENLPMREFLNLPMTGKLDLAFALELPNEDIAGQKSATWKRAEGFIELGCPNGCTLGDGKTKLKPLLKNSRNQIMVGDGIEFGKVMIDQLVARAEIKDGKLEVSRFETKSRDGELHVEFAIPKLEKELMASVVNGCLRFNGSETLRKREPKTYAQLTTTGAELRADGLFHIKLMGPMREMLRLNAECGPTAQKDAPGVPARPNLVVHPDDPVRPIPPPPVTPPPPPPPTAPPPTATGSAPAPPPTTGRPAGSDGEAAPAGSAMGAGTGSTAPAPTPAPGPPPNGLQ